MTRRMSVAEFNELRASGKVDLSQATITGGNWSDDQPKKKWSNAKPNTINGIKFPSKVQARVFLRLLELFGKERVRLDVRMPLLAGSKENGRVHYMTIDFCVIDNAKPILWIDAKTPRKSREWERGLSMWRQTWPEVILWDGIGEIPDTAGAT